MFTKASLDCRLRRAYHLESALDLGWCWKGFFLSFLFLTIKIILPSSTSVIFVWSFRHFGVPELVSVWSLLKFLLSLGWFCLFFSIYGLPYLYWHLWNSSEQLLNPHSILRISFRITLEQTSPGHEVTCQSIAQLIFTVEWQNWLCTKKKVITSTQLMHCLYLSNNIVTEQMMLFEFTWVISVISM